ncbi:MAG: FlgD immunoglobulin-like domain containing protein [Bacteroidota bacterium]
MTRWNLRRRIPAALLLLLAVSAFAQDPGVPRRPLPLREAATPPPLAPAVRASVLAADTVGLPWSDDAEKGPGLWARDGMWHWMFRPQRISVLSPTIFPNLVIYPDSGVLPSSFSGNAAWWFGEDSTGTFIGNDFNRNQAKLSGGDSRRIITGSLVSPPINLVGHQSAILSFMTWWEIEGVDTYAFDLMHVEASTTGGLSWVSLGRGILNPLNDVNGEPWKAYSSGGLGQRGQWIRQFFDLAGVAGNVVLLRFRFDSGDMQYNGFRGWLIDDVTVRDTTLPPPVIIGVTPQVVGVGHVVNVLGANFANGASIQVDTVIVASAVLSANLATFSAPTIAGTHSLRLTNPDGQSDQALRAFTVSLAAAPTISSIQPDTVLVGVGANFTIFGNNFATGVAVDFGGILASNVVFVDSTRITGISPPTLAPGVYNVRVTNPTGLSDVLILAFRVIVPQIYVDALGDSLAGKSQGLSIIPPAGTLFTSGTLYYRAGGTRAYDSLTLSTVIGEFRGDIPASAMTLRGVEYWIQLRSATGASMTYPLNSPALAPARFPVRLSSIPAPNVLRAQRYQMVSAPVDLSYPAPVLQLSDDFGIYNVARWRLFRWEGGDYREFVKIGAQFTPGRAFWLVTAGGTSFDFKGGTSVNTSQNYYVQLDTGWNQIADPFAFPVAWASVGVVGNVSPPFFYDGVQYRIDSVLVPFQGYFVRNFSQIPAQLIFQPIEASLFVIGKAASSGAVQSGDCRLQISAVLPGTDFRDSYNFVGFRYGATAGADALDAPKPPPIGDGLEVRIIDDGVAYLENFKPAGDEGQSWVVSVVGHGVRGKALVGFTTEGSLPAGYELHVLDLSDENAVVTGGAPVEASIPEPEVPRYYKVIIGTAAYAEKERQQIPLEPVAYALEQNYPNPFNPETKIRFALAKRSDMTLEVFNTLGQRVRTLVTGIQSTGTHEVTWDGTGDGGAHVASGVYFYRLRTEEYNAVRKLVLIR